MKTITNESGDEIVSEHNTICDLWVGLAQFLRPFLSRVAFLGVMIIKINSFSYSWWLDPLYTTQQTSTILHMIWFAELLICSVSTNDQTFQNSKNQTNVKKSGHLEGETIVSIAPSSPVRIVNLLQEISGATSKKGLPLPSPNNRVKLNSMSLRVRRRDGGTSLAPLTQPRLKLTAHVAV